MSARCDCGDPLCPSCGSWQGTLPRLPGESAQHARERMAWERAGPLGIAPSDSETVDCPTCNGTGTVPDVIAWTGGPEPCDTCDGAGWIFQAELDSMEVQS